MSTVDRPAPGPGSDAELIDAVRAGDESAFVELIHAHHALLIRAAMSYVSNRAVAEDVVQETWRGVLEGLDRFEGRPSPRTWIFGIMESIARTRAAREARSLPSSSLAPVAAEVSGPSVDPDRFLPLDHRCRPRGWAHEPDASETPEELGRSHEVQEVILCALEHLAPAQRLVVTLRDVGGWSAEETCDALELTDVDQRVLLHRARTQLRGALERHLSPVETVA